MSTCGIHPAVSSERISMNIEDCLATIGGEPLIMMASNSSSTAEVRSEFTTEEGDKTDNVGKESFSFQTTEDNQEIKIEEIEIGVKPENVVLASEFEVRSTNVNSSEVKDPLIKDRGNVKEEDPLGLPAECKNEWSQTAPVHSEKKCIRVRKDLALASANSHPTAFFENPNLSQSTATFEGTNNHIRVRKDLAPTLTVGHPPTFYETPNLSQSTAIFKGTNQNYRIAFNSTDSIPALCFEPGLMNCNSISGTNHQQIYYSNGIFFTINTGIISNDIQPTAPVPVMSNNTFEPNPKDNLFRLPDNHTNSSFLTGNPQTYHPMEANVNKISTKSDNCSAQQFKKLLPKECKKPAKKVHKSGPPVPDVPSFCKSGPPILSVCANNSHFEAHPVSSDDQQIGAYILMNCENYSSDPQHSTPAVLTSPLEGILIDGSQEGIDEHTNSKKSAKSQSHQKDRSHVKKNISIRGFDCAAWQPRVLLHRTQLAESLAGALKFNKVQKSSSRCSASKVSSVKKKASKVKNQPNLESAMGATPKQQFLSSNSYFSDSTNFEDDLSPDFYEELFSEVLSAPPERNFTCVHCSATFKTNNRLKSHLNVCSAEEPTLNVCSAEKPALDLCSAEKPAPDVCSAEERVLNVCSVEKPALCEESDTSSKAKQVSKKAHLDESYYYTCVECSAKFSAKLKLQNHLKIHMKKKYSCKFCSATFKSKGKMTDHLKRDHSDKNSYVCEVCSVTFTFPGQLRKHSVVHAGETPFACTHCPRKYRYKNQLKAHLVTHSIERPFLCPHCPASFKNKVGLNIHSVIHSGERPYLCDRCGKRFKLRTEVMLHLRFHSDKRAFQCTQCAAAFFFNRDLYRHSLTHSPLPMERRFKCLHPHCYAAFNARHHLLRHSTVHSNERPVKCIQCSARFKTERMMRRHLIRRHSCKFSVACTECGGKFRTEEGLRKHSVVHLDVKPVKSVLAIEDIKEERIYLCADCPDMKFKKKEYLRLHMRYHSNERPFVCKKCRSAFKTNSDLRRHKKIHANERRHRCSQCSAAFIESHHLRSHMEVHSNVKPYTCTLCPASFKRKRQVTVHMSVHSKDKPFLCADCAATFKSKLGLKYHIEHAHSKNVK